ncbi:MAG TPA: tripartite tricarboxylate transporter substrate binding protein [Alphaproteobacteria bacterium]|nr:tripartite tricarboxylate transporter substrate binding protein [Alphaproteobacteria bacterium]
MKRMLGLLAAVLLMSVPGVAQAQYPTKPVRVIVHIPPGGAPDIAARVLADRLAETLGQPFVVENRPGSNGVIASELTAKAPPDGHTLFLAPDSAIVINPHLYATLPIDPLKDLAPVATVGANDFVLSINPSLPVKTFPEFVEYARKANPPLAYASGGNGSQHHLTMEMLKKTAGFDLVHVPYRGGAPATTATVSGEVAVMFAGSSTAPQIRAGNLRALAVTGTKPSSAFPDLPTIAQFYPGFSNSIWLALFAPAGTPAPIIERLRKEVNAALANSDVKDKFNRAGGLEPLVTTPDEFATMIRADYDKYGQIVKSVGVKID